MEKQLINKITKHVKDVGWSIIVTGLENQNKKTILMAYTIGLFHTFNHPEIVVFGLSGNTAHQILNNCGILIKEQKEIFEENTAYTEIIHGYACIFKSVKYASASKFLYVNNGFYKKEYKTIQLLWPDQNGFFPTDFSFNKSLLKFHKRLYDK